MIRKEKFMKIRDGVEMLEVAVNFRGTPGFIYPTLLWDSSQVILVDTGFPGQLPPVCSLSACRR